MENMKTELRIDPEFESKIPPLTADELARLHSSILFEGRLICPIVAWNGVVVDGHNRYKFILQHPEIKYDIYEMDFENRNEAIAWICKNQLGRRNLTPEQKKYLIGKQYEAERQARGGDRKSEEAQSKYQDETLSADTGTRIAKQNNVSRISVLRAYGFSSGIDLAEEAVPGIKEEILSGALQATDAEIMKIAKAEPEKRPALVAKLRQPKPSKLPKSPREKMTFNPKHYEKPVLQKEPKTLTVSDILLDIGEAADTFIYSWAKLQREYADFLQDEEMVTGVKEYIEEIREYMQSVEIFLAERTTQEN